MTTANIANTKLLGINGGLQLKRLLTLCDQHLNPISGGVVCKQCEKKLLYITINFGFNRYYIYIRTESDDKPNIQQLENQKKDQGSDASCTDRDKKNIVI